MSTVSSISTSNTFDVDSEGLNEDQVLPLVIDTNEFDETDVALADFQSFVYSLSSAWR